MALVSQMFATLRSRMDVVAVTGGSGLTGRFVVDRLLKCGRYKEIRIIDRVPSSRTELHIIHINTSRGAD
ncbi:hypothetical protein Y032_0084g1797 [Ancylostoma ceylanicum]|uniref:3-beta hydroxysteroid dehydrogenase/isomerase domain-containing protein n=1 Tax=Ancylostoma ceylanicum TaxID=53326 RepID=A0A016TR76_9BILA|nr:hypothetical protein Y032_0084g1797 [Ancylostoma ceylanicum]